VPLASLVRGHGTTPTRLVVFRRPIEHRCESRAELEAMVLTVLVEQVAELLGIQAEDVDPRYSGDD
jgi:predicted Zn-dependent protease with MMP-like domain